MSLYNVLFGTNKSADVLLKCLGFSRGDIPRFRDCFLSEGEIVIHTRTGGGNREDYEEGNGAMQAHPCYISDEDDDFDCTYANFHFSFPEEYAAELKEMSEAGEDFKPSEKWQALLASFSLESN